MQRVRLIGLMLLATALPGCDIMRQLFTVYKSGDLVGSNHAALLYGFDQIQHPGHDVTLQAKLCSPRSFKGVENATLAFSVDGRPVGEALTNARGVATVTWRPTGEGLHVAHVRVLYVPTETCDDYPETLSQTVDMTVAIRPTTRKIIVADIDHTLVDAGWVSVATKKNPQAMPHAAKVLRELSSQFDIVYLTQRPQILTRKTKAWLEQNKFPPGILVTTPTRKSIGSGYDAKIGPLRILKQAYPNTLYGVGDKPTDMRAYREAGLEAIVIIHPDWSDPRDVDDMIEMLRALPDQTHTQAAEDWLQIRAIILEHRKFPPNKLADKLDAELKRTGK